MYINEWKKNGSFVVHKFSVAGSTRLHVVYNVYEPSAVLGMHHSITHNQDFGGWLGTPTSRPLPADIDAIPVRVDGQWNDARFQAIDAWRAGVAEQCYAAILAAFPEAAGGRRRDGEIECIGRGYDGRSTRAIAP